MQWQTHTQTDTQKESVKEKETAAKDCLNYAFICMRPYHHVPQSLLSVVLSLCVR